MGNYKNVVVKYDKDEELIEVHPKYVYLVIPSEYVCIYHKLLVYLADFGKVLLNDCSASCKGDTKTVIDCWNIFQSAIACKALGQDKQADLFITYIESQLNNIYKGTNKDVYDETIVLPIDEKGELNAIISCGDVPIFKVDVETGQLLQMNEENANIKDMYSLDKEDVESE